MYFVEDKPDNALVAGSSPPPRPDRRVHRTRRALGQALVELTLHKGYEAVSIRDLTERADVGYATFFRHYPDKDALLQSLLEETLAELLELVLPVAHDPAHAATRLFEHVQSRPDLYRVLLSLPPSHPLVQRVFEVGVENILRVSPPRRGGAVPADLAAEHLMASVLRLLRRWLEQGMPYPPARMGEILSALVIEPARRLAFGP